MGVSGNKLGDKKYGTIRDLDILSNARVSYGTVCTNSPTSIFIKLKSWSYLKNEIDLNKLELVRKRLNKNMRQYVNNVINRDIFDNNKTIIIDEMPVTQMKKGKGTYIAVDITLFQKGLISIDDKIIKQEIINITLGLNSFFKNSDIFTFIKNKRK